MLSVQELHEKRREIYKEWFIDYMETKEKDIIEANNEGYTALILINTMHDYDRKDLLVKLSDIDLVNELLAENYPGFRLECRNYENLLGIKHQKYILSWKEE